MLVNHFAFNGTNIKDEKQKPYYCDHADQLSVGPIPELPSKATEQEDGHNLQIEKVMNKIVQKICTHQGNGQ